MKIRVGHSPDADDAFMFYALAKKKIPMQGFEVEHVIEDIESLNQRALGTGSFSLPTGQAGARKGACPPYVQTEKGSGTILKSKNGARPQLEVTAVSCHAYAYLADRYAVMRSGASVGAGYGPVLARSTEYGVKPVDTGSVPRTPYPVQKIAIPGKLTTANLVLQLYEKLEIKSPYPVLRTPYEFVFMPFDQIMDAVKSGAVDYGLLIHEGQITFAEHGLEKVLDLGAWWHEKTKLPLPLGVDIIRRDLGLKTMREFAALFKESIEYALNHREEALEYALRFGRGISPKVNDRFVGMYVNDRTLDIGKDGEEGFRKLLDEAFTHQLIPHRVNLEFV